MKPGDAITVGGVLVALWVNSGMPWGLFFWLCLAGFCANGWQEWRKYKSRRNSYYKAFGTQKQNKGAA